MEPPEWCDSLVQCGRGFIAIGAPRSNSTEREKPDQYDERHDPEEHDGRRAKEKRWSIQHVVRQRVLFGQTPECGADSVLVSGSHAAAGWHFSRRLVRRGKFRRRRELRRTAFVR